VGDHFARGPSFLGKTLKELQQVLGADLGTAFEHARQGEWQTYPGRRGVHLVRINRSAGGTADFEQVRASVRLALIAQLKEQKSKQFAEETKRQYEFQGGI
jgi:hypothetical protein